MQVFALALLLAHNSLSSKVFIDAALGVPALVAGTALGLALFGRMSDAVFRRAILGVLFVAGLALIV